MSSNLPKNLFTSVVLIALTAITGGLVFWLKYVRKRDYKRVATVAKLVIYPVKSLSGIEVDEVQVTLSGVKHGPFRDRSWMLVNKDNQFITQRVEPSLALVRSSLHNNELCLDAPNMATLKLRPRHGLIMGDDVLIETKVWEKPIKGIDCGAEAEHWFSQYLKKSGTKLIESVDGLALRSSRAQRNGKIVNDHRYEIMYQDGTGVHLVNQTSLDDLNSRLAQESTFKVSERNFRPNILVTDCPPFEEDKWRNIVIHDVRLTFLKPCERCVVTTIDPDTGVRSNGEPLRALKKYRLAPEPLRKLYGTSPLFGISIAAENEGVIRRGDHVLADY